MGNIFDSDKLQESVENCAEKLFNKLGSSSLCIVHYLSGPRQRAGAIRKSAVRARACPLASLAKDAITRHKKTHGGLCSEADLHREVIARHVQHIHREHTFLNVVEEAMQTCPTADWLELHVEQRSDAGEHVFHIPTDAEESGEENPVIKWFYGPALLSSLMPYSSDEYIECLYGPAKETSDARWMRTFEMARAEAFGRSIQEANDRGKEQAAIFASKSNIWSRLPALQSSLLYFRFGGKQNEAPTATCLFTRFEGQEDVSSVGGAIVCPAIPLNDRGARRVIKDILKRELKKAHNHLFPSESDNRIGKIESDQYNLPISDEGRTRLWTKLNTLPKLLCGRQRTRNRAFCLWSMRLAELLREARHEGTPLDFFSVVGDKSQFKDRRSITFRDFRELAIEARHGLNVLGMPPVKNDKSLDNWPKRADRQAKAAARALSREHFPWFCGGKYALFWDISGDDLRPSGLVGLPGGGWDHVVVDRFADVLSVDLPECMAVFTTGNPSEASLLHVEPVVAEQSDVGPKRVTELARWHDGKWRVLQDTRRKRLRRRLVDRLGKANKDFINRLLDYVIRLADNPSTGGIFLLTNRAPDVGSSLFPAMGTPWRWPNASPEDRLALIAHDGASDMPIQGTEEHWQHRLLLFSKDIHPSAPKDLVKHSMKKEFCLTSAGSRRWSAAIAAFHPKVMAVLVVSQDGDIQLWHAPEKYAGDLRDVVIEQYSQNGDISRYPPRKQRKPSKGGGG